MCLTKTLATRQYQNFALKYLSSYQKQNEPIKVRCSKCGNFAERHFTELTTTTECFGCDYWIITNTATGEVIDTPFSGLYSH